MALLAFLVCIEFGGLGHDVDTVAQRVRQAEILLDKQDRQIGTFEALETLPNDLENDRRQKLATSTSRSHVVQSSAPRPMSRPARIWSWRARASVGAVTRPTIGSTCPSATIRAASATWAKLA